MLTISFDGFNIVSVYNTLTLPQYFYKALSTASKSVISTNSTVIPKRVNECQKRANVQPYTLLLEINTSPAFKNVHNVDEIAPIPLAVTIHSSACSKIAILFSTIYEVGFYNLE